MRGRRIMTIFQRTFMCRGFTWTRIWSASANGSRSVTDATNNGYGFTNAGAGKAANQPVQSVDWYDRVKWCNARSQQAGLTPAYYTDPAWTQVYTNGETNGGLPTNW